MRTPPVKLRPFRAVFTLQAHCPGCVLCLKCTLRRPHLLWDRFWCVFCVLLDLFERPSTLDLFACGSGNSQSQAMHSRTVQPRRITFHTDPFKRCGCVDSFYVRAIRGGYKALWTAVVCAGIFCRRRRPDERERKMQCCTKLLCVRGFGVSVVMMGTYVPLNVGRGSTSYRVQTTSSRRCTFEVPDMATQRCEGSTTKLQEAC